ncbi:amidoligase family protein [Fodinibius salsisoli]|uniref:Amidoligase family protein n=1 Tax=Fodinibius salsisoli TaxID=2820877 RepID=A0ABT3PR50_9BACT|nr:amidoligase family protein [Fodinibius salsisoli]MCW9708339.1 amidoligase family protein [Fodinibius salsisoli]
MADPYPSPPVKTNSEGNPRNVGFELEFAGISITKTAQIICNLFGGSIKQNNRYDVQVTDTELGHFTVELDARVLQKIARQDVFDTSNLDLEEGSFRKSVEEMIDKLAMSVVPIEIVMPPIPLNKLSRLEVLRRALQENRAEGTKASLVHAFGMHINVEAPDLRTPTLLRYLRAFLLVYPWLLSKLNIDISRRISPFVDPFPERYVRNILDPKYDPDKAQFVEDYLKFNPSRNRPLDMMPILGMHNSERVQQVMKGEKNRPRPTFHYRLPNSRIDDESWRFTEELAYWMVAEQLAEDQEMLQKLSRLYLVRDRDTLLSFHKEWAQTIAILLDLDE